MHICDDEFYVCAESQKCTNIFRFLSIALSFTDSQTVDLKEITIEEEEFPTSPVSVSDIKLSIYMYCYECLLQGLEEDDDFGDVGQVFVQQDNMDTNSIGAMEYDKFIPMKINAGYLYCVQ